MDIADTAWRSAETLGPQLRDDDRRVVFVELGAGKPWRATAMLLVAARRVDTPIPAHLATELHGWLDRYRPGTEQAPPARSARSAASAPGIVRTGVAANGRNLGPSAAVTVADLTIHIHHPGGFVTEILKADLDAMARLRPQLVELAGQVRSGLPGSISAEVSEGASPSRAAADRLLTGTVRVIRVTVATRFDRIADFCETVRTEIDRISKSPVSLDTAWGRMPGLQSPVPGK